MDHLTAADLFSPSKARQQRAQAQDWAQIDSWLSYKYAGRSVPTFERNDDTLKVLRELSMANERADEESVIHERLEREALKELDETTMHPDDKRLLDTIAAGIAPSGAESLHALASTAVVLNVPSSNPETIAHALIKHTSTAQNLTNDLAHISTLQSYLEQQHAILRTQLLDLQSNLAFSTPPNLQRQATDQVRQTKHLRSKIREAEDKISFLQSAQTRDGGRRGTDVSSAEAIADMLEQQKELDDIKQKVENLERQLEDFAGLPADREAARKEVGRLEVELDGLRRRRDALFGDLLDK